MLFHVSPACEIKGIPVWNIRLFVFACLGWFWKLPLLKAKMVHVFCFSGASASSGPSFWCSEAGAQIPDEAEAAESEEPREAA